MEARIAETEAAGDLLAQHPLRERATWLAHAFATLVDAETPLGKRAREELPASTGLSAAMIEACLRDALDGLSADALVNFIDAIPTPGPRALAVRAGRLCVVVLAGNVFTAVLRAMLWPLRLQTASCRASSKARCGPTPAYPSPKPSPWSASKTTTTQRSAPCSTKPT